MSTPNTMKHPDYIGSGRVNALIQKGVNVTTFGTDAQSPSCLELGFVSAPFAGSTPAVNPYAATVAISGSGKTLTIAVKNRDVDGSANSDVSFVITFGAAKVAWSAGAASAYSLKEVIDLLNEDDAGGTSGKLLQCIKAQIGPGGRYDMVMNGAATFLTVAAKYIQGVGINQDMTGCLPRDMAVSTEDSDFFLYWRLGMPEEKDRRSFKLLDIWGTVGTDTGATVALSGGVIVIRDDDENYVTPGGTWATDLANHEMYYHMDAASLPSYPNYVGAGALIHNPNEAAALRGPLLVIVKGNTDTAQTVNLKAIMQAVL